LGIAEAMLSFYASIFLAAFIFVGLVALAWHLYFCLKVPERAFLISRQSEISLLGWSWLGLIGFGWGAVIFLGAHTTFSLLPIGDEIPVGLAVVVTFASFVFLIAIDHMCSRNLERRKDFETAKEAARLALQPLASVQPRLVTEKEKLSLVDDDSSAPLSSAERLRRTISIRENYAYTLGFQKGLKELTNQTQKESDSKTNQRFWDPRADRLLEYREAIDRVSVNLPTWSDNSLPISSGSYAIDTETVRQVRRGFEAFIQHVAHGGTEQQFASALETHLLVKVRDGVALSLLKSGTDLDGYLDFACKGKTGVRALLAALQPPESLSQRIAIFLLVYELPHHMAWGHGRYDRDHSLVFGKDSAVTILRAEKVEPKSMAEKLQGVTFGLTLTVSSDRAVELKCIGYEFKRGFSEFGLGFTGYDIVLSNARKIWHWSDGVFY
jgi:hypothetical protein